MTSVSFLSGREVDIYVARELATRMAADVGFDQYACADIETAISELCSNAIKYGGGGWASLRVSVEGLNAVVTDEGPGIEAPPGKKVGLGVGLEGAGRLMDTLEVRQLERGTQVAMSKIHPNGPRQIGVMGGRRRRRANRGQTVSGDRWWAGGLEMSCSPSWQTGWVRAGRCRSGRRRSGHHFPTGLPSSSR